MFPFLHLFSFHLSSALVGCVLNLNLSTITNVYTSYQLGDVRTNEYIHEQRLRERETSFKEGRMGWELEWYV